MLSSFPLRVLLLAGLLASAAACRRYEGSDSAEQEHPRMREAMELANRQDLPGAIALCRELLRDKPGFARAHLQLGFMYQSQNDHVRAVYHYSEYLALRPESNKRDVVEQMIADERSRLAAGGPVKIPDVPTDVAELLKENEHLRRRLAAPTRGSPPAGGEPGDPALLAEKNRRLEQEYRILMRDHEELRQTLNNVLARLDERNAAGGAGLETPVDPGGRTYVVQAGDTLSRIAVKMYDDPQAWRKIFNANKQILTREDRLRVGQTLAIP